MKKKTFLMNSLILTITSLIARTIGMSFRVYMANKIGAEGIGLYQLICTVYSFVAMLSISGMSIAVTRLVTKFIATNNKLKISNIIKISILISVCISFITGYLLYIFADQIAIYIVKDTRSALPLKILAPSLPLMSISSCLRGYFYAVRKVIYTSLEQILEQIVEITVFIIIISIISIHNTEYSCCAIVIGTTSAELISAIFSLTCYAIDIKKYTLSYSKSNNNYLNSNYYNNNNNNNQNTFDIIKNIIIISLPITLVSCLRSGLSLIENSLIPQGLKMFGTSSQSSLAIYGILIGMVSPFISFPAVFISSFSLLLIPELSESLECNHIKNISYMSTRILQVTLIFSIMISGIFIAFSNKLAIITFNDESIGFYIKVLAPLIPLIYLDGIVDGMLKGLNQQLHSLAYNVIDASIRIILIYFFLPIYGIKALVSIIFISNILNSSLSIFRLIKITKININIMDWIVKPILSIIIVCNISNVISRFLFSIISFKNLNLIVYASICIVIILYITLLILIKSIKHEDISWFKSIFIS